MASTESPIHVSVCADRGHTRFRQLVDWCGKDFDGLIIFDESELENPNLQAANHYAVWLHLGRGQVALLARGPTGSNSIPASCGTTCKCAPGVLASNRLLLPPSAVCVRGRPQGQEPGA